MKASGLLQSKIEDAISEFISVLYDDEFLEQIIGKNTDDLPEELREFVAEMVTKIMHRIREQALEESSAYYKQKQKGGKE